MTTNDDFDDFSFPSLTEEELAEIDLLSQGDLSNSEITGGPAVPIQIEDFHSDTSEVANLLSEGAMSARIYARSPFQRFRSRSLSVTDLVAPLWCEVQFDYGLTQRRRAPVEKRPTKFVTDAGKTIVVAQSIAESNDKILKKGTRVHAKLEQEIHKDKVYIQTDSEEEGWALKLVNTMTRLEVLRNSGRCREVFVWGFINNNLILGCIDEIVCESLIDQKLLSPGKGKRRNMKLAEPVKTADLSAYFSVTSHRSNSFPHYRSLHSKAPRSSHTFQLIDNKTRWSNTIPSHADTLSSRIQLMIYWRLLSDMVSDKQEFDFDFLWTRLQIEPLRLFSVTFQSEIMMLMLNNGLDVDGADINCLEALIEPFRRTVAKLQIAGNIDDSLYLVYRLRGENSSHTQRKHNVTHQISSDVVEEVASKPIQDTQDIIIDLTDIDESQESIEGTYKEETEDPELQWALKESLRQFQEEKRFVPEDTKSAVELEVINDNEVQQDKNHELRMLPKVKDKRIIGKKKFKYNAQLLDEHVTRVLDWWHGNRPPKGVEITETQRCFTCEYSDGCEWREQKAKEFAEVTVTPAQNED